MIERASNAGKTVKLGQADGYLIGSVYPIQFQISLWLWESYAWPLRLL